MVYIQYYSNQQNGLTDDLFRQDQAQWVYRKMHQNQEQLHFHQELDQLPRQVPSPRFRCTRDIPRLPNMMYRPRTDSEEVNLRLVNLWSYHTLLISDVYKLILPILFTKLVFSNLYYQIGKGLQDANFFTTNNQGQYL